MFALHSVGVTGPDLRLRNNDHRPAVTPSPGLRARNLRRKSAEPGGPSFRSFLRSGGYSRLLTVWKVSLVIAPRHTSSQSASRISGGKPPEQASRIAGKNDAPLLSKNLAIRSASSLRGPRSVATCSGGASKGSTSV